MKSGKNRIEQRFSASATYAERLSCGSENGQFEKPENTELIYLSTKPRDNDGDFPVFPIASGDYTSTGPRLVDHFFNGMVGCPYCSHPNFDSKVAEASEDAVYADCKCWRCERTWLSVFALHSIHANNEEYLNNE